MLKLFFASSALIPVIFLSLNVQAKSGVEASQPEGLSYNVSVDQKLDQMSDCQTTEIPVYFHDQYVTQHSAELINTVADVTQNCKIESLNMVLYNNNETSDMMSGREGQLKSYLQATDLDAPIEARIEESERDSLWLNGRRAVIEFNLKRKTELVATS